VRQAQNTALDPDRAGDEGLVIDQMLRTSAECGVDMMPTDASFHLISDLESSARPPVAGKSTLARKAARIARYLA